MQLHGCVISACHRGRIFSTTVESKCKRHCVFPRNSCYKLVYDDKSNWLESTHKCWDEEAQLVSLEVADEMPRVAGLRKNSGALNVLTSAMRFSDGWYWVGSSE